MPYIIQAERDAIRDGKRPENVGQLNYCLTMMLRESHLHFDQLVELLSDICRQYIRDKETLRYQLVNDVFGALTCCMLEMEERLKSRNPGKVRFLKRVVERCIKCLYLEIAVPYEKRKIEENGDVETYLV